MIKMSFFNSPKIRIFKKGFTHDYGQKFLIFFERISITFL